MWMCLKTGESEYLKIDILRGTLWLTMIIYCWTIRNMWHPSDLLTARGWVGIIFMAPKSMSSRPGYPLQYDEKPVLSALRSDNAMFAIQITKKTVPSSLLPRWVAARQCCHGAAAGDGAGEGHSVAVGAASPAGGKPRRPGEMEPTRLGNLRPKTGKRWNMRSKSLAKWRFDHLKFGDSSNQQQVWFTIWFEILKHQECGFEPNGIWASCWKTLQVWIGRARCGLDDTWIVTESGSIS